MFPVKDRNHRSASESMACCW